MCIIMDKTAIMFRLCFCILLATHGCCCALARTCMISSDDIVSVQKPHDCGEVHCNICTGLHMKGSPCLGFDSRLFLYTNDS